MLNLNKLNRGPLGDAPYKISSPCGFRQEDISCIPYLSLCKTCDPGVGSFWAPGHNLNKRNIGLLDDAPYQMSRLFPFFSQNSLCFND